MAECTEAERALVEAAIKAVCDEPSYEMSQTMQAFGGGQRLPEALVSAVKRVALERITPAHKDRLRKLFVSKRELHIEEARLRENVPGSVWSDLVKEVYPREKTDG